MNSNVDLMEDLATIHAFADQIRNVQSGTLVVPSATTSMLPYVSTAPVAPPVYAEPRVLPSTAYPYPPSRVERYRWWIIGVVSLCAAGVVALLVWLVIALVHAVTTVVAGAATGLAGVLPLLALIVLALLLCGRGGGGGKTFSGTFTGRMH